MTLEVYNFISLMRFYYKIVSREIYNISNYALEKKRHGALKIPMLRIGGLVNAILVNNCKIIFNV